MRFYEYESRRIVERAGIPVTDFGFTRDPAEAAEHAATILELEINGNMPKGVLVDPKAEIAQEYYAGVVWDGTRKCPLMLFSDMGGIDIEEVAEEHPDHVGRGHLSNLVDPPDFRAKEVISHTGVTVPSAFDTCVKETILVRGLSSFSY